jgi:glycosyltransferase involved in cell wall biosynthesis
VRHHVVVPPRRVGWVTDEEAIDAIREAGADVHLMSMRRSPITAANVSALAAVRRLAARIRPDVVHGHSSVGGAIARLATLGLPVARVYTPNAISTARPYLALERRLGRLTHRLVAVSAGEGALVVANGIVPADRVVVIANGIELEPAPGPAVDLRGTLDVPPGAPLVGTVSRLVDQKAPEDFVAACSTVARARPDVWFALIGDGPLAAEVDAAAARLGLASRLRRLAALPGVGRALGQLDVFVLSSRFEGGPYTPLEAMREGTPVVLTDVIGNRDVVVDGTTGLLVPVSDPQALGTAVIRLLSDDALRRQLVETARIRLVEQFDVRDMGRRLRALYEELAWARRPPAPA